MPEFCTCGAQLPPDARFCHKCGKPQREEPSIAVEESAPVIPVAAASQAPKVPDISFSNGPAVRIGFFAALITVPLIVIPGPFQFPRLVAAFVIAGFLAVFFYVRRTGQKLSLRAGARMGWITGVFSFTIFTAVFTISMVALSTQGDIATVLKQQLPPNDPRAEQFLDLLNKPSEMALQMLMGLLFFFVIVTLLPAIGGALGAKFLTREH